MKKFYIFKENDWDRLKFKGQRLFFKKRSHKFCKKKILDISVINMSQTYCRTNFDNLAELHYANWNQLQQNL